MLDYGKLVDFHSHNNYKLSSHATHESIIKCLFNSFNIKRIKSFIQCRQLSSSISELKINCEIF
jgi:hypothetical protein